MPPASVVSLRQSEPDRMSALLARRDAVHAEINRLNRPAETLVQARAALAAAEAGLAEREQAKRRAWESWSLAPTGEPPEGDPEEHRALEQRRALAASDVRSGEVAVAAVAPRTAELLAELRRLGGQIFEAKLSAVMAEVEGIENATLAAHATMTSNLNQLRGLFDALAQEKSAADNRHDEASATLIQGAMVRIQATREPKATSDWAAHQLAVAAWREKFR